MLSPANVEVFQQDSPRHAIDGQVVDDQHQLRGRVDPQRAEHDSGARVQPGPRRHQNVVGQLVGRPQQAGRIDGANVGHRQHPPAGAVVVDPQPQHRVSVHQCLQHDFRVGFGGSGGRLDHHGLVELIDGSLSFLEPVNDRCGDHPTEAFVDGAVTVGGQCGDSAESGDGLLDEDVSRAAHHAGRTGPGHYLHRQNAVAAQVEERVVDTNPLDPEHLGVDAGQNLFDRVAGRAVAVHILVLRRGQRPGVELAVDGQRKRVQHHHRDRHHVRREPLGQLAANLVRVRGPGDVTDQPLVARTVLAGDHRRLAYPVDGGERGLNLTELDAVAADLDLLVGTPQVTQLPVSAPGDQVAGAIHPRSRRTERAGDETCRRQIRPADVTAGHSGAGNVQLADHPGRHRPQPAVQNEECQVRQRHTDGAAVAVDVGVDYLAERGVHGGLGNAVHVDHPRQAGVVVQPRLKALRLKRFATEHHSLQLQLLAQLRLQGVGGLQRVERRRCLTQHADLLADQQGVQVFGRADHGVGHHDHPATVQQRTPDLPDGVVEGQGVALRPHLAQLHFGVERLQQLDDIAVSDGHALGLSGGAGGVDDVRDVVGRRRRQARVGRGLDRRVVDVDDLEVDALEPGPQVRGGQCGDRRGVGEHELHPGRRVCGIHWQIGRTRLQHRQQRDDRLGGSVEQHGDSLARAGSEIGQ